MVKKGKGHEILSIKLVNALLHVRMILINCYLIIKIGF